MARLGRPKGRMRLSASSLVQDAGPKRNCGNSSLRGGRAIVRSSPLLSSSRSIIRASDGKGSMANMRTATTVRPSRGARSLRARWASDHITTTNNKLVCALRRTMSIALTAVLAAGLMPTTSLAWATEEIRGGGRAF